MQIWQNQYVHDLAWVISAPCIIEHKAIPSHEFFTREYEQFLPILEQLDKQPQELIEFLQKSKRKALGIYFEDLIEFWLRRRADTKIITRNMQIIEDKTTLGECDFIVDFDGALTHLEVAIKYYLGIKNSTAQDCWVGRGLTDRLDMKYHKIFEQQLDLMDSQNNFVKIDTKMAIVKGFFFKHYFTHNHALPIHTPANLQESFWCRINEIDSLPVHYQNWQILTKPHWMTYDDVKFARAELKHRAQEYFDNVKKTPVLCNAFSTNQVAPTKFFIAPSCWGFSYP